MFERFTRASRAVVVAAQAHARDLDHRTVTSAHLLLALAADERSAGVLAAHGVTPGTVREALQELTSRDPRAADDDAAVLAALGIDMDRIRRAVEASFGPGALDRAVPDTPRGLLGRLLPFRAGRSGRLPRDEVRALRLPGGAPSGHVPFSPPAKKALELALREAILAGDREIGPVHLVLGLLRTTDGAAAAVLDRLGVDVAAVRHDLDQARRRSA